MKISFSKSKPQISRPKPMTGHEAYVLALFAANKNIENFGSVKTRPSLTDVQEKDFYEV